MLRIRLHVLPYVETYQDSPWTPPLVAAPSLAAATDGTSPPRLRFCPLFQSVALCRVRLCSHIVVRSRRSVGSSRSRSMLPHLIIVSGRGGLELGSWCRVLTLSARRCSKAMLPWDSFVLGCLHVRSTPRGGTRVTSDFGSHFEVARNPRGLLPLFPCLPSWEFP